MGRYIFTYEGENPLKSVTLEIADDELSLSDLLPEIQNFLRSSGYFFDDDYSYLDLVSRDPREQPEVNDCAEDDWAETNWISKKENDMFPQKEGQQWQTNGWDDNSVDGPTEFRFNGISEKDLTKGFYKREG